MQVAITNVTELRDFGQQVQLMGEQMTAIMLQAQQRLSQISEGWHDEKNELFRVQFEESVRQISRMADEFRDYNNYIRRACDIMDQYRSTRI